MSSKAAAPEPATAVAPKAVPAAAERSEPKTAKVTSATAGKAAAAKAADPSKAKTATPSKAAAAKKTATPGKAATAKATPAKRSRVGVVQPTPGEKGVPGGTPLALPANEELFVQYKQDGDEDVIGPEGERRSCLLL